MRKETVGTRTKICSKMAALQLYVSYILYYWKILWNSYNLQYFNMSNGFMENCELFLLIFSYSDFQLILERFWKGGKLFDSFNYHALFIPPGCPKWCNTWHTWTDRVRVPRPGRRQSPCCAAWPPALRSSGSRFRCPPSPAPASTRSPAANPVKLTPA